MSFCKNRVQQININEIQKKLSPREIKYLENSWAKDFAEKIFPAINEERFAVLYSNNPASRPNNPVNVYIGLLILKEIFGQSDEQALESLMFDIRYQYALHTIHLEEQPVSKNSLSNFRSALYRYFKEYGIDLIQQEVEALAEECCKLLNISGRTIRMDSLMIEASCQKLSRLTLMYNCLSRATKEVMQQEGAADIPAELKPYTQDKHRTEMLYKVTNEEAEEKIQAIIAASEQLLEWSMEKQIGTAGKEMQLLKRLLEEQTIESEGTRIKKPSEELTADSLSNPTDPDATYRYKSGRSHIGYVGNVVEKFDGAEGIIAYYDVQPNVYSDVRFTEDVLEKLPPQIEETIMLIDGAYYSNELAKRAREKKITLMPSNIVGRLPRGDYSLFELDEGGKVISCRQGHSPVESKINGEICRAQFSKEHCGECKIREYCSVQEQKSNYALKMKEVQYNAAIIRNMLGTEEYRQQVRQRSAIEGIMSILRRRYHVDNMSVRGLVRVKIVFGLKIAAINIHRCFSEIQKRRKTRQRNRKGLVAESFSQFYRRKSKLFRESEECLA